MTSFDPASTYLSIRTGVGLIGGSRRGPASHGVRPPPGRERRAWRNLRHSRAYAGAAVRLHDDCAHVGFLTAVAAS